MSTCPRRNKKQNYEPDSECNVSPLKRKRKSTVHLHLCIYYLPLSAYFSVWACAEGRCLIVRGLHGPKEHQLVFNNAGKYPQQSGDTHAHRIWHFIVSGLGNAHNVCLGLCMCVSISSVVTFYGERLWLREEASWQMSVSGGQMVFWCWLQACLRRRCLFFAYQGQILSTRTRQSHRPGSTLPQAISAFYWHHYEMSLSFAFFLMSFPLPVSLSLSVSLQITEW